jgi:hypothetical protein
MSRPGAADPVQDSADEKPGHEGSDAATKKANRERLAFFLDRGGAEEDRTPDLRIANAALSQLSYGPTMLPEQGADLTMTVRVQAIPRAAFFPASIAKYPRRASIEARPMPDPTGSPTPRVTVRPGAAASTTERLEVQVSIDFVVTASAKLRNFSARPIRCRHADQQDGAAGCGRRTG